MIYKNDVKEYLKKYSEKLDIIVDNDTIYTKSGDHMCTLDEYVNALKIKIGCSFTSIYYNHATLYNILKCNKCDTVIFTTEDEDYDPHLKCPTCTDYKTHFKYYTKEQIESDKDISNIIDNYIRLNKFENEAYEYEERHGHPYWQIFKHKFYTKKYMYDIELKCDDVRKSWFKGLHLTTSVFKKLDDCENGYRYKNHIIIPLSFRQIYVHWIYPHLGICHKDFRSKWYIGKAIEERKNERS